MKDEQLSHSLKILREALEESATEYEQEADSWWDNLPTSEREKAFYSVCKRITKADMTDRGTYRYGLYDVFGFDASMYARGMDCGYLAIHNAIVDSMCDDNEHVNRFEVIDENGRSYTNHKVHSVELSYQDGDQTLKVFINS